MGTDASDLRQTAHDLSFGEYASPSFALAFPHFFQAGIPPGLCENFEAPRSLLKV